MHLLRHHKGVTLIELLLVIAIIAIIASSSTPFLSSFVLRTRLEASTDYVISFLRKAQEYSMDGKNDASWGVCVTGSVLRLYRGGTCGAPVFSEDTTIPNTISITGLSGVTFSSLRGEPSSAISVTISSAIASRTVSVNTAGGMTIN